jgi:hypothetical protein
MTHLRVSGEIVPPTRRHSEVEISMTALASTLLAADYPFLDVMWTMFIFFAWVIFIYLLILVLADNFRRHDHSGWAKAAWTVFVIFVPLLGVLIYMIARPKEDLLEA